MESIEIPIGLAQTRYASELRTGSNWNVGFGWRLRGPLGERALHNALNALVARHEALRTIVTQNGSTLVQHIAPRMSVPLPVRRLPRGDTVEEAMGMAVAAEASTPFRLGEPLLRAALYPAGDDDQLFVFLLQHSMTDGDAFDIVFVELQELIAAELAERPPKLSPPAVQYREFVEHERRPVEQKERDFWRTQLAPLPPYALRRTRAADLEDAVAKQLPPMSSAVGEGLAECARRARVSLAMLVFASIAISARTDPAQQLRLSVINANRGVDRFRSVVGQLVDTLPIRLVMPASGPLDVVLQRMRSAWLSSLAHALPCVQLAELAGVDAHRDGINDISMNFLPFNTEESWRSDFTDAHGRKVTITNVSALSEELHVDVPDHPLWEPLSYIAIAQRDGSLRCEINCDPREISPVLLETLAERWSETLTTIARTPDVMLEELEGCLPAFPTTLYEL